MVHEALGALELVAPVPALADLLVAQRAAGRPVLGVDADDDLVGLRGEVRRARGLQLERQLVGGFGVLLVEGVQATLEVRAAGTVPRVGRREGQQDRTQQNEGDRYGSEGHTDSSLAGGCGARVFEPAPLGTPLPPRGYTSYLRGIPGRRVPRADEGDP